MSQKQMNHQKMNDILDDLEYFKRLIIDIASIPKSVFDNCGDRGKL